MIFSIEHKTSYRYERPVGLTLHRIYLCPRIGYGMRLIDYQLTTNPTGEIRWVRDFYENTYILMDFAGQSQELFETTMRAQVEMDEMNPYHFLLDNHAIAFPFTYSHAEKIVLHPHLQQKTPGGASGVLDWFYKNIPQHRQDTVPFLSTLNQAVYSHFGYERRDEENTYTPDELIALGQGSCRDLAFFFIALAQQLGLAARYVSGYVYEGSAGSNRAAGSMHAWAEIYLPGAGWRGFDPTNGVLANHNFMPVAVARDPRQIDPIQGNYLNKESGIASTLAVELTINLN